MFKKNYLSTSKQTVETSIRWAHKDHKDDLKKTEYIYLILFSTEFYQKFKWKGVACKRGVGSRPKDLFTFCTTRICSKSW